jgi:hypothetical protein
MVPKGWKRRFDEPIELPGGGKLYTLKDAIAWLAKEIPQSEHGTKEVQTAARCVTEAAENDGPMIFARIAVMQAINRHVVRVFNRDRKDHHWGRRQLARDR